MKKIISLSLILIFSVSIINAQFLKEVDLSTLSRIDNENDADLSEFGFSSDDEIPEEFSLEAFALVSNQGESSSCTGFAVANGAMSILYNIVNRIYDWNEQHVNRFDPFYIYCSLKDENDIECISGGGCDCGSLINEGLDLIMNYGSKKMYLYPDLECSATLNKSVLRSMTDYTGIYDIDDYINLFDYEEKNGKWYTSIDIDEVKWAISNMNPIIAGINVNDDFSDLNPNNNVYSAKKGMDGRHAVTIVGYDDNMHGGAFKVLNSYGYDWGDDGFFWMTYKDFVNQGDVAYVIIKEDWASWRSTVDIRDFYKGFIGDDESKTWEGPMDDNGYCHGRGIIVAKDYTAIGTFENGIPNGWWLWYDDYDVEDQWSGWILFEDGELVEEEEFGFSSSNASNNLADLHINNMELKLSDKDVSKDHFTEDRLNFIKKEK
jgi:hypothetical protein